MKPTVSCARKTGCLLYTSSLIVMLEGSEDAMRKAEAELKHYNIEVEVLKCWNN